MATVDPDSFIQEHGAEAMQAVIDDALPLTASMLHQILVRGEVPDPKLLNARVLCERDLLNVCGAILGIVHKMRDGEASWADGDSTAKQHAVVAAAARGMLSPQRLAMVPMSTFTGAPRLFAWVCAAQSGRVLGRRSTMWHARYVLTTSPNVLPPQAPICKADIAAFREAHGYDATVEWLLSVAEGAAPGTMAWLRRETARELDEAENTPVDGDVVGRLLLDQRRRETQAWLDPIAAAMAKGEPMTDTAARLRQAADIFEGRTTSEGRRR